MGRIELLPGPKLMLIVIDGVGDRPSRKLGFKTPLEAARKPNMDRMAREGCVGWHYPLSPGVAAGSGIAHMALFGYGESECPGRGVFEALGAGIELKEGDVAARINFATCDEMEVIVDRRAGRDGRYLDDLAKEIEEKLAENPFGVRIEVKHTTQHRGVIVVRGWKGECEVRDTDPGREGFKPILPKGKREIDRLIRFIHRKARKVMKESEWNKKREKEGINPANCLLIRGVGKYFPVEPFEERMGLRGAAIADNPLYLGVARFLGMKAFWVEDEEKVEKALELLGKYDFVFVHFKKTDNASHDGDCEKKRREIEKIDKLLKPLLELEDVALAITGDHATPCELKEHSGDPVPVLFWGKNVPKDDVERFGEMEVRRGWVGEIRGVDVLPMLINLAGRMKEVGK